MRLDEGLYLESLYDSLNYICSYTTLSPKAYCIHTPELSDAGLCGTFSAPWVQLLGVMI